MKTTNIEWTHFSANPLKYRDEKGRVVWACVKHSSGCLHCYSETIAHHYDRGGPFTRAVTEKLTPFLDDKDLRKILTAKVIDKVPVAGKRCFLGDMTDVFGEWVPDELLDRLFAVIALRPDVTFQLLTKRADRMREYFGGDYPHPGSGRVIAIRQATAEFNALAGCPTEAITFPLPNVWLGTSVENQAAADERIPHLLKTPAAVRFLSCEPLLGPVDLEWWMGAMCRDCRGATNNNECLRCAGLGWVALPEGGCQDATRLHWVIVGGESGKGARPARIEWMRSLVSQCRTAGVAVFVKQMGQSVISRNDCFGGYAAADWPDSLDPLTQIEHDIHGFREEYQGADVLITLNDKKGGDPDEWPEDLRIREFPKVAA